MEWYAWALVIYIVIDRLLGIAYIGKSIEITKAFVILSMISGFLIIWAVVSAATS